VATQKVWFIKTDASLANLVAIQNAAKLKVSDIKTASQKEAVFFFNSAF
jgi:hypothetical protein